MRANQTEPKRAGWGLVAARFTLGLVGGLVNALAIFATPVAVLAYAFGPQEGDWYAAGVHIGYVAFNGMALYFLLKMLGDEERRVVPTIVLWTITTATVLVLYWNWALG